MVQEYCLSTWQHPHNPCRKWDRKCLCDNFENYSQLTCDIIKAVCYWAGEMQFNQDFVQHKKWHLSSKWTLKAPRPISNKEVLYLVGVQPYLQDNGDYIQYHRKSYWIWVNTDTSVYIFFHVVQFALIKGLPTLDKEVKRKNKAQTRLFLNKIINLNQLKVENDLLFDSSVCCLSLAKEKWWSKLYWLFIWSTLFIEQ